MDAVVVDTNVIVVANNASEQAAEECVTCCQEQLNQIQRGSRKLIIDDDDLIITEYRRNVKPKTQSRSGDLFWLWVVRHQWYQERCIRVIITPSENGTNFEEFPVDPALNDFDTDDRKFIAVAVAYKRNTHQKAVILQAVDSKWYAFRDALEQNDLKIAFICEEDILRILSQKESNP